MPLKMQVVLALMGFSSLGENLSPICAEMDGQDQVRGVDKI